MKKSLNETNLAFKLDRMREERALVYKAYLRANAENFQLKNELIALKSEVANLRYAADRAVETMRQLGASL